MTHNSILTNRFRRFALAAVLSLLVPAIGGQPAIGARTAGRVTLAPKGLTVLRNDVVPNVAKGRLRALGGLSPNSRLLVSFGLPLRNERGLDAFIARDALHGRYLTQTKFDSRFSPSIAQLERLRQWAADSGFRTVYQAPDRLLLTVEAGAEVLERALHTPIDLYREGRNTFYANRVSPAVPAVLGIQTISGLNDFERAQRAELRRTDAPDSGFTPEQFQAAYDVAGHGFDGTDQTIGIIDYGSKIEDADLARFASYTGEPQIHSCRKCSGPDRLQWFLLPGSHAVNADSGDDEQALDIEYSHGMAIHSHLKFWLGDDDGSDADMEAAIDDAASDPSVHVVSNSWVESPVTGRNDPFVRATTNFFKKAVAVGTTFYFASGDAGAASGCNNPVGDCTLVAYPSSSPYVMAVGGTSLQMDGSFSHRQSETAWSDSRDDSSGGGCAVYFSRPSWQKGISGASCKGRAIPDVAADGAFPGALVYVDGISYSVWGTSLATPLISGMAAVTDRYLALNHRPRMGFSAPRLYALARSPDYSAYFHPILCGGNGFPEGYGWNEVTGWGSLDWYAFAQGWAGQAVTPPSVPPGWICHPGSGTGGDLTAIACPAQGHCHAVGASGIIRNSEDGWFWSAPKSSSAKQTLIAVACPSTKYCYALGADGWLQRTNTAGKTWRARYLHTKSTPNGLSCPSTKVCFVAAGREILTTASGKPSRQLANPATSTIVSISCPTLTTCYALQADGVVLSTHNGRSWRSTNPQGPIGGSLDALDCPAKTRCYAVGGSGTNGIIYATTDGKTWSLQTTPATGPLQAVSCANSHVCDATGRGGAVIRTINGGTWGESPVPPSSGFSFQAITCPTTSICYGAGNHGLIVQIGATPSH